MEGAKRCYHGEEASVSALLSSPDTHAGVGVLSQHKQRLRGDNNRGAKVTKKH